MSLNDSVVVVGQKRTCSNSGGSSTNGSPRSSEHAKRIRYDCMTSQIQVVPNLEISPNASTATATTSTASIIGDGRVLHGVEVPKPGTPVDRKLQKRVGGKYLLGPNIGNGVEAISQYLARLEHTNQYFQLKILVLDTDPSCKKTVESEKQGKLLLHSEYQLLKMLENEDGVIRAYDLFSDYAFEEEAAAKTGGRSTEFVYTGRVKRRIVLVVDCLSAHDFDDKSSVFINLQQYVIREKNLSEIKTMLVFYEIIKIVENLHKKNIVHRDLKLRNIILNTMTNKVVITNFCLGKQLLNENDYLHDQRGSPAYISPDVLSASNERPYKGKPSDIWALGVVLFTMLYSQFPFFETKPAALFKRIKSVDYKIPKHTKVSSCTLYLIKNMLLLNPEERLTATEIRDYVERMISEKRQFFLRIDQVVPQIDVDAIKKGTAAALDEGRTAATTTESNSDTSSDSMRLPTFELSRAQFGPAVAQEELDRQKEEEEQAQEQRDDQCSSLGSTSGSSTYRRLQRWTVQRVERDARILTPDESMVFRGLIRQHSTTTTTPTTSQSLRAPSSATTPSSSSQPAQSSASYVNSLGSGNVPQRLVRLAQVQHQQQQQQQSQLLHPPQPSPQHTARISGAGSSSVPISQQMSNLSLRNRLNMTNGQAARAAPSRRNAPENSRSLAPPSDEPQSPSEEVERLNLMQNIYFVHALQRPSASPARPSVPVELASRRSFVHRIRRSASMVGRVPYIRLFTRNNNENNNGSNAPYYRSLNTTEYDELMPLDGAAAAFLETINNLFIWGRLPNRGSEDRLIEFNGELTNELAEAIGDWLLLDCSDSVIVRDIFGGDSGTSATSGEGATTTTTTTTTTPPPQPPTTQSIGIVNAKEKVLELLRRCGVQVENGPNSIAIKRAQTFNSVILLSFLLQATGYNNNYFV